MHSAMQSTHPKGLEQYLGKALTHYLIVAYNKANETCPRIWPGLLSQDNLFYRPFDDPASASGTEEKQLDYFSLARDEIRDKLDEWVKEH